ncbi:MAG: IclR family transcriptional regulator [Pseudomonadota bacterium]
MSSLQLGTLEKAYKILDLYNEHAESFTFSEIVEKTGLEKGSVQRLLYTLQNLGLLRRHQRYKRYSLSPRFISYAVSHLQTDPLLIQATKYLEPLARQTTESVGLGIMDGIHVFYINRIPNLVSHDFALLPVRRYAYCTAAGRAIMSRLSERDIDNILEHSPMRRFTSRTVIDKTELRRLLAQAREEGVAWQDGEIFDMEMGVAAPVMGDGDMPVGAVTISIEKSRYSLDVARERFTDLVRAAAQDMSSPALSASRFPPSWGG